MNGLEVYIGFATEIVGPCLTCETDLIGSGPVAAVIDSEGRRGWVCDGCLTAEDSLLGSVMTLLQRLRHLGEVIMSFPEPEHPLGLEVVITSNLKRLAAMSTESESWIPRASEDEVAVRSTVLVSGRLYEVLLRGKLKLIQVEAVDDAEVAFSHLATWHQLRCYWRGVDQPQQKTLSRLTFLAQISDARMFTRRRSETPEIERGMTYEVVVRDVLYLVKLVDEKRLQVKLKFLARRSRAGFYLPTPPSDPTRMMALSTFRLLIQAAYMRSPG